MRKSRFSFVSWTLRRLGFEPRIIPAIYVKHFSKGQKNDYNNAEAIAEAALRPNLKSVTEKSQDQFELQALHRVRSRLVSRRTGTITQIRAFLIEQGVAVRSGLRALKTSFLTILDEREAEIPPRMKRILVGLYRSRGHLLFGVMKGDRCRQEVGPPCTIPRKHTRTAENQR